MVFKRFRSLFFVALMVIVRYGQGTNQTVEEAFKGNEVVPDVVPKAPKELAFVKYPTDVEANLGNELAPVQVKDTPAVFWNATSGHYYTLAMVDPDAPSRAKPIIAEFLHWLVGNIPSDYVHSKEKSDILAEYVGAAPPPLTGLHRYVFLIYEQPSKLAFNERRLNDTSNVGRLRFSIERFSKRYNLGDPIAGNFYQSRFDQYVPILQAQLGDYSYLPCLTEPAKCY